MAKIYNLLVELKENREHTKEAQDQVKAYKEETKRIQAEIDDIMDEKDAAVTLNKDGE